MNSGLNLQFTNDEIMSFLQKNGYVVEKVKTFIEEKIPNDRVNTHECEIYITYPRVKSFLKENKHRPNESDLKQNAIYLDSKYGLGVVFSKLIKEKLLKL
jgi:hypothetical protein